MVIRARDGVCEALRQEEETKLLVCCHGLKERHQDYAQSSVSNKTNVPERFSIHLTFYCWYSVHLDAIGEVERWVERF